MNGVERVNGHGGLEVNDQCLQVLATLTMASVSFMMEAYKVMNDTDYS